MMLFIYFLYYLISALNPAFSSSVSDQTFSCSSLSETHKSPFVVILLYKSSGSFLGTGGILDKTTIITSTSTIKVAKEKIDDILVLAGYLSPWWGENAQVRHAHATYISEFEVALLEIEPELIFSKRIRPLNILALAHDDKEQTAYGVNVDRFWKSGEPVLKTAVYHPFKHLSTSLNDCVTAFSNIPELTQTTHLCLFVNNTFCKGNLGSPVTRVERDSSNPYFLGIIIRSECANQEMLMVRLNTFVDWINYINTNRGL